jgi:hypothetical protein
LKSKLQQGLEGAFVGDKVGSDDGDDDGGDDGDDDGAEDGFELGFELGSVDGELDGFADGDTVGESVCGVDSNKSDGRHIMKLFASGWQTSPSQQALRLFSHPVQRARHCSVGFPFGIHPTPS